MLSKTCQKLMTKTMSKTHGNNNTMTIITNILYQMTGRPHDDALQEIRATEDIIEEPDAAELRLSGEAARALRRRDFRCERRAQAARARAAETNSMIKKGDEVKKTKRILPGTGTETRTSGWQQMHANLMKNSNVFVINSGHPGIWQKPVQRGPVTSQADEDWEGKEEQGPVALHAGAEGLRARSVRVAVQTGCYPADAP